MLAAVTAEAGMVHSQEAGSSVCLGFTHLWFKIVHCDESFNLNTVCHSAVPTLVMTYLGYRPGKSCASLLLAHLQVGK
jgi:hypothetical protein